MAAGILWGSGIGTGGDTYTWQFPLSAPHLPIPQFNIVGGRFTSGSGLIDQWLTRIDHDLTLQVPLVPLVGAGGVTGFRDSAGAYQALLWLATHPDRTARYIPDLSVSSRYIPFSLLEHSISRTLHGLTHVDISLHVRFSEMFETVNALSDNGGVITDETTDANDDDANDVVLIPAAQAPGDAFYVGSTGAIFGAVGFQVSTPTDAGNDASGVWEYWNGAWTSMGTVVDPTNGFRNSGLHIVRFSAGQDWITTSVNGVGPTYWVRRRNTNNSPTAIAGLGTRVSIIRPPFTFAY